MEYDIVDNNETRVMMKNVEKAATDGEKREITKWGRWQDGIIPFNFAKGKRLCLQFK